MEKKDKKRLIIGGVVLAGTGLAALLSRRGEAPPGEGYGKIWGYVKDALGGRISGARVYIDDNLEFTSGINGEYSTGYYPFGEHRLVVEADNYETLTTTLVIAEESVKTEIRLNPLPEAPTHWTEGVVVREIKVDPLLAYTGETVEIKVYVEYPWPEFEGVHIDGEIIVNGQVWSGSIDAPETIMRFQYPVTAPGLYTVLAQDKSAHFQVEQSVGGTYYMPWGGERMPLCTDIAIPAAPFTLLRGDTVVYDHPGGEVRFSDLYAGQHLPGGSYTTTFQFYYPFQNVPEILAGLPHARPVAWTPANASVSGYAVAYSQESRQYHTPYVTIMAVEYTCQPYWASLQELAAVIANGLGYAGVKVPEEWIEQYGTTCPVCGGTGIAIGRWREEGTCRECHGLGKVLKVDLRRGWRDWAKAIKYASICGAGRCTPRLYCPYGDHYVEGAPHPQALSWDVESFARMFLRHIEEKHPNHPLTEPAF